VEFGTKADPDRTQQIKDHLCELLGVPEWRLLGYRSPLEQLAVEANTPEGETNSDRLEAVLFMYASFEELTRALPDPYIATTTVEADLRGHTALLGQLDHDESGDGSSSTPSGPPTTSEDSSA